MALLLWLAPALGVPSASLAAPGVAEQRRVELRVLGSPAAVDLVRRTSLELFERLDVNVEVLEHDEPSSIARRPLIVASIDLTRPTTRLKLVDGGSGDSIDERSFTEPSLEAAVEAAMHVTFLVVESRLTRAPGRPTTSSPPTPAAPSAPAPSPPVGETSSPPPVEVDRSRVAVVEPRMRPPGFDAGVAVGAIGMGQARPLPGIGLITELFVGDADVHPGIMLGLTTYAPDEVEHQGAIVNIRPTSLRLLGTLDLALTPTVTSTLGAGPGVDWLHVEPVTSSEEFDTTGTQSLFTTLVSVMLGVRFQLGTRSFLTLLGGVDATLNDAQLVATDNDANAVVLPVPKVRPVFMLAASTSLSTPTRFDHGR